MEQDYLGRKEAPLSAEVWKLLDTTMIEAAKSQLAGRRLIKYRKARSGSDSRVIPLSDSEIAEGITSSPGYPGKPGDEHILPGTSGTWPLREGPDPGLGLGCQCRDGVCT